jgi:hypothetical protein
MTLRYRMAAFSALVLGTLVVAGCGSSTTNEDDIAKAGSATATGNAKQYGSYKEFAEAQAQQAKEAAAEKKAAKGAAKK